jgi:ribosomal protein S20
MADEPTTQTDQAQPTPGDAWRDVGKQFEALGQSLATALRAVRESEETRKHTQAMQSGLETMVKEVSQAIQETAASPEGQKARAEARKAAESLRAAGAHTWQEARPHLASTLRQLSADLQKMIAQLEQEESARAGATSDQPKAE